MILGLNEDKQHQHPNGGGWVANTATVAPTAYVFGDAQVSGNAWVYGNAQVSGDARVYGNAQVSGDAWVYGNAQVSGNARVSGNAQVSGDARVYGDAWVLNPLEINGSAHVVTLVSYTQIAIGCQVRTFSDWLKNYKTVGKENGYSLEQIKEYGEILKYLVKAAKVYIKRNQKLIAK